MPSPSHSCRFYHPHNIGIISLYSINWLVFRLFCKIAEGDYYFRHVCQSVCPHGATRLPLDEFLWNFICEHFQNPLRKSKFHWNLTKLTATFHKDPSTFLIISRLFIPRMWNVSDEICRGKQNTNFVFDNVFGESFHLWDNMDKYCTGHRWQYGNIVWCGVWWMWAVLAAVFFRSTDLLVIKVCSLLCKLAVLKFRVGRGGGHRCWNVWLWRSSPCFLLIRSLLLLARRNRRHFTFQVLNCLDPNSSW